MNGKEQFFVYCPHSYFMEHVLPFVYDVILFFFSTYMEAYLLYNENCRF